MTGVIYEKAADDHDMHVVCRTDGVRTVLLAPRKHEIASDHRDHPPH